MSDNPIGIVRPVDINSEMRDSYLDYAMSVIVARALPDARDGLKPVHRRILYAMHDMGLRANSAYKKSARLVGDVLGKYHPHGDSAVYDAMARMAQDFSLRYPLVDGQGNFGSVDGDSPAAMRYTEARLSLIAEELLTDIDMDTVDFTDNYDGTTKEPSVLPARLPNMLLNGTSGIAVGMATSVPPHNLRELASALRYVIDHHARRDEITVDELMQFVKAPDFPTAASVIVSDELREAYATGRGRVVVRATSEVEEGRGDRMRLIFTAIPYQVSKVAIIERIVALVREGRLPAIADLRDESDRRGMRLVVELKSGAQPKTVLNQLYKYTQLQSTYSIQMLALVDGEPRTLSLRRMLTIYIDHRVEVIERRSRFELGKRRARAHILEGLLKALSSLDAIIQTIRAADDAEGARTALVSRFDLSEAQASAILEMQLRRLAALEQQKLQNEYDEVMARIDYLEDLLASPEKVLALIRDDLDYLETTFGDDRRTTVLHGVNADFNDSDLVRDEGVVVLLSHAGYVKRVPLQAYRAQRRGGRGVSAMVVKDDDVIALIVGGNSLDTLLFFTDRGRVYSERAFNIPENSRAGKGTHIQSILALQPEERVTSIVPVSSFNDGGCFVMATQGGRIKRVHVSEFEAVRPSGLIAMSLDPGDALRWVKLTDGDQDILLVTEQGQSIRFGETKVRQMGRSAAGVNSIRLVEGDQVAGMDVIRARDTHLLVITSNGYGKRTPLDDYNRQGRYGSGVRTLARHEKTGYIVAMHCLSEEDDILIVTSGNVILRTQLGGIRETGRNTVGVRVIKLRRGDVIAAVTVVTRDAMERDADSTGIATVDESEPLEADDDVIVVDETLEGDTD